MMIYPNNLSSKKEDPIYLLVPQPHAFRNKEESQRPQAKMEKKELILLLKGSAAVVCRLDHQHVICSFSDIDFYYLFNWL